MANLDVARPAAGDATAASPTPWRRDLGFVASAVFVCTAGWTMVSPFFSVYLHDELHVTDLHQLAFWAGLCAGLAPLSIALMSPFWGAFADIRGRKLVLMASLAGAALFSPTMGLSRTPLELAAAVALVGLAGGVTPASVALVATQTPRGRVSSALGFLYAGRAAGQAIGPLIGGALLAITSFRAIVFGLGALYAVVLLAVRFGVTKVAPQASAAKGRLRAALTGLDARTRSSLLALVLCALATQMAFAGAQPMIVVRLVSITGAGASTAAGVAFAVLSGSAVLAAVTCSRFTMRFGFRPTCAAALVILAAGLVISAATGSVPVQVAAAAVMGLGYGAVSPTINTAIGFQAPDAAKAAIFGASNSAFALGSGAGPLLGGLVAAATEPRVSLGCSALIALGAAGLVLRGTSERR